MATTTSPVPEAEPSIGAVGRLTGALFNPKETFADIARRPSWVAPIVLLSILGMGVGIVLNQRVDWANFFRQQNEKNSRIAQMSEEQKQQVVSSQMKFAPASAYVFGTLGAACVALILALVYWGAFNLLAGAELNFGRSFGITSHALLPTAIGSVLAIITMFLKSPGEVDPEHLLASNVGALLGSDSPKWLASLGSSLDIFWIWVLILLATGFSLANPKKIPMGKAIGTVFGIWALWLVVKIGFAAAFS
jgi:hypothetical protein